MWNWLVRDWQWPAAALFTAVFLLVLTPLVFHLAGLGLALLFVQLPIYMIHQWEEHRQDRFRLYINRTIGGGKEALTPSATFWINSLGVWCVDIVALYLAWAIAPWAGLAAGYLAVVNAIPHVAMSVRSREYNPGVITATLLFLPIGGWCIAEIGSQSSWEANAVALLIAVGVHIAIVVHVTRRLARLQRNAPLAPNLNSVHGLSHK
ncbi:HXXEE domain-containing protein [Bremerella sp. JC770]|uniref:HXXEE domain-containing protein n=1 Tax=Bremerella sp. JC770 TaxID=3232137 RepID=UPI003457CEC0